MVNSSTSATHHDITSICPFYLFACMCTFTHMTVIVLQQ
uniref:Uncharacterized protein n=1 Tax=Arundo donax TaxID=35708 RepID=A0A0A9F7W2_ARUDO